MSTSQPPLDTTLNHNGTRSLSSIAVHGFALGLTLATTLLLTLHLTVTTYHPLWRIPQFLATLSIFHFLEFYTTARWNTPSAKVSSYLLFSNGAAYTIAHSCAMLEILLNSVIFPRWQQETLTYTWTITGGLLLVVMGQVVRSTAMAQAGTNFNHVPARQREEGHELVTHGVYAHLRHPAYFGFFWWAVGTQVVVGNKLCTTVYAAVLWQFFRKRIVGEERYLVEFFGEDYMVYRKRTATGIPFIQ